MKTIKIWFVGGLILCSFMFALQSLGCLPQQRFDKYEELYDDEEKFIYEAIRADGYSHEEARDSVINTRGDYH